MGACAEVGVGGGHGPAPSEGSSAGRAGNVEAVVLADALEPAELSARPICFPLGSHARSLGLGFLQGAWALATPTLAQ